MSISNKKEMFVNVIAYYKLLFSLYEEVRNVSAKKSAKHSLLLTAISLASNPENIFKKTQRILYTYYSISNKNEIEELIKKINQISFYFIDTYLYPEFVYELTELDKTIRFKNFEALFSYLERNPKYIEAKIETLFPLVKDYIVSAITVPLSLVKVNQIKAEKNNKNKKALYFKFKDEKSEYLSLVAKQLSYEGYIGEGEHVILCDILQGKAVTETINWRKDKSSLKILINRLLEIEYLNISSSKWKTVSMWFMVQGVKIEPESFRKLHPTLDSHKILDILSVDIE